MEFTWIILVTLALAAVQRYIFRRWGLHAIVYERYWNVEHCFVGDKVELVEKISNNKLLPIPWLRLESLIAAGIKFQKQNFHEISEGGLFQNHRSLFSLLPYRQITRRHHVVCMQRGYYQLQTVTMSYGDILGIQCDSLTSKVNATLTVYPAPLNLDHSDMPNHSLLGDIVVRRWMMDDPFMIAGVREYMPGDALNKINWQASARTHQLQVSKFDFTADHHVMIYLNIEVSDLMWYTVTDPGMIEQGIRYAAALAEMSIEQGISIGFGANALAVDSNEESIRIMPNSGKEQLYFIFDAMAKLVLECKQSFQAFLAKDLAEASPQTDYIIITSYMNEKIQNALDQLTRNGSAVQIIQLTKEQPHAESI